MPLVNPIDRHAVELHWLAFLLTGRRAPVSRLRSTASTRRGHGEW
jgi:hypothetical protein